MTGRHASTATGTTISTRVGWRPHHNETGHRHHPRTRPRPSGSRLSDAGAPSLPSPAPQRHAGTGRPLRWATRTERHRLQRRADVLYRAGHSLQAIAAILGWSRNFVRGLLLTAGTPLRPKGRQSFLAALTPAERTALATTAGTLYQEGASLASVAKEIGTNKQVTRTLICEAGVGIRIRTDTPAAPARTDTPPPSPYDSRRRQTTLRLL